MSKDPEPVNTTSTQNQRTTPRYNPRVLDLIGQETSLVDELLFPLEGRLQQQQRQLLNPDMAPYASTMAPITQAQNLASQVGAYMPESIAGQGFVQDLPAHELLALRQQAPAILAQINRALVDPRFAQLLQPMGQDVTNTTNTTSEGGGPSTASQVMSGIGTAASFAGIALA